VQPACRGNTKKQRITISIEYLAQGYLGGGSIVIVIRTTAGESGAGAVHQQRFTLEYICLNNST
jgi:hypothetical protein